MTALPVVPDITTGVSDTSKFAQLMAVVNFLMAPPRVQVRQTVAQSLTSGVFSAITFTTEDWDLDPTGTSTQHDTGANTSRFTAIYPGKYEFSGAVGFAAS